MIALRAYTSSSYTCFNRPFRKKQRPHPFAMTVYYAAEGLRLLRAVAAQVREYVSTVRTVLYLRTYFSPSLRR